MTTDEEILNAVSEDPYVETVYDDGSIEFDFDEESVNNIIQQEGVVNYNDMHYYNLAEDIEEPILNGIGQDVLMRFEDDKGSRAEWLETVNSGLHLLGIELEETNDPFPGACSAHHPLILESAVKFQAKASAALFTSKGPVKTAVIGDLSEDKEKQAQRVRNHMNYQVEYQMKEFFDETEKMLFYLPVVGSAFKKTYYDALLDRPCSMFVPVDQFVVNYFATSLETASCFTHMIQRMDNDLKKDQKNGLYRDIDITSMPSTVTDLGETEFTVDEIMGTHPSNEDNVYTLLEQYCHLNLEEDPEADEDGIALPYVVTVVYETGKVLSIRRNWQEDDSQKKMLVPFTHYKFVPGLGFYGLGFIHLLGNLQMTLTSAMRNLVDSGAFATMQGGFVDKRLRLKSGDGPLAPGQFRDVESGGMALRDAIMNLPFKEPSNVLLSMYQFIEERGQKFADSTEQVVSDSTNYGPVGTTMALLEASTKFFSGVHKRLHKSQKHEFSILASLNYEYLGTSETFDIVGSTFDISREDYDGSIDVVPVSDPNLGSQAQQLSIANAVYTNALQNPEIHDMYQISKYVYNTMGVDDDQIDKFLPSPEEPVKADPLSDISAAQQGKPIKAFQGQDHDAHIAVKSSFLQDPQSGANPMFQMVVPVIQANIQEHLILKFQKDIAGTVASGGQNSQGMEQQAIVAQAAQQVAQRNQRMAELEAQGPDAARNKLADAEVQRALNETRKLEIDNEEKLVQRTFDALELQLKKYAEDNKVLIAEMQAQQQLQNRQIQEMSSLISKAVDVQESAEDKAVDKPEKEE